MFRPVILTGFLAALVGKVYADTGNSEFTSIDTVEDDTDYTDNVVYTPGNKMTISWTTDYDKVGLLLWQVNTAGDATNSISLVSDSSSTEVSWTVTADWLDSSTGDSDGYIAAAYLALYESGSTSYAVRSASFNITTSDDDDDSSSSSSAIESTEAASTAEAKTETVVNEVTVTGAAATKAATTEAAVTTDAAATTDAASTDAAGGVTSIPLTGSDASATADSTSTASASSTATPAASASKLSTGGIAGITVGSVVSLLSALGGLGFVRKRKQRQRKAKAAALEIKMQQQSQQSTQIHIQQAAAPSPPAPPAAGHYQQDHKGAYPPTHSHTPSYAPTHSTQSPVYPGQQAPGYPPAPYPAQSPVQQPPAHWNNSPAQNHPGYAPPQWNQGNPGDGNSPDYNQGQGYGQGNNGAHEAP
ncbi:hypothetical protein G7Z17_g1090 [Cylindrodendrum hubeiense]|uniref:Uncharacterized protein n=1 Tax=Cylindrodendrum hubeiense TaxID=595255 RepID=A0A9P5HM49_9HYPO|nr:hypothetical protein G7Z17_g1090 [Cylindrodendrum hubeiense]